MVEIILYFAICFVGGIGVGKGSWFIVWLCIASAWILGRYYG